MTATSCARWPAASPACRTQPTACPRSSTPRCRPMRDERGLIVDFQIEGEFPCFGNNDDRVDDIAADLVSTMMNKIRKYPTYRDAGAYAVGADDHLQRGLRQGDRQHAGRPQERRAVRARAPIRCTAATRTARWPLMSVAKIPYDDAEDGISSPCRSCPASRTRARSEPWPARSKALDTYFGQRRLPRQHQRARTARRCRTR